MARRKSHKKRHHTSRRRKTHRMAGIGGTLTSAAYIIGGGIIAQAVSGAISKATASSSMSTMTKGLLTGAVPIVAGVFTPKFIKGDVGAKLGAGMIAVGGIKLVQAAGVLNGLGAIMNPYRNMPVQNIAGYQGASQGTYIAGINSTKTSAILEQC
jgi:hypothetical protein